METNPRDSIPCPCTLPRPMLLGGSVEAVQKRRGQAGLAGANPACWDANVCKPGPWAP